MHGSSRCVQYLRIAVLFDALAFNQIDAGIDFTLRLGGDGDPTLYRREVGEEVVLCLYWEA